MPKLTTADIGGMYDELGQMRVEVDPNPNRGIQYVKERIVLCKAMRDRTAELLLASSRALSTVMQEELTLRLEYRLSPTTALQQRIETTAGERKDHLLLVQMVKAQMTILSRTSMDIRLLAELTKEQIKLGEIDPKDAPGLVKAVTTEELADSFIVSDPPPVAAPADSEVTLSPPSDIIKGIEDEAAPVPQEAPVDFDDLFGALNNGQPGARLN